MVGGQVSGVPLQKKIRILSAILLVLAAALFALVILASLNQRALNHTQDIRYRSHLLADELRESSDKLTTTARTYVVTGDPKYERLYWETLAVRNGEKPRPDGRNVSLRQLMQELGFSSAEMEKLRQAEFNSNELVKTEERAMRAVTSHAGPADLEKARRSMFDEKYHQDKAAIMGPLLEVGRLLDTRTFGEVNQHVFRGNLYLGLITVLVLGIALTGLSLGIAISRQRRIEEERQKEVEELTQAVRVRDEFLAVASHELRTPLTPLRLKVEGGLRLLTHPVSPQEDHDRFEKLLRWIYDDCLRIQRLMENLLDVTLISSGGLRLKPETFDLDDLVKHIVQSLEPLAAKQGYKLELTHESVKGTWDRTRLDQVVTNLITNAMKFGNQRPISIHLGKKDNTARIVVTDQGIGIDPKDQQRIFERYARAVQVEKYSGFGLGLYIAKQIIEKHSGTICLESTPGQGSSFIVELPLEPKQS